MVSASQLLSQYTTDQIWEKFDVLPEGLKDALLSPQVLDELDIVARNNNISVDPNPLVSVTHAVLLGIVPIQNFREALQQDLLIDENKARNIAYEVRDKVFSTLAEDLRLVHNIPQSQSPPAPLAAS